jgi:4-amino-4-deoxy-L-arabinose transferase-like glycosyltransferase
MVFSAVLHSVIVILFEGGVLPFHLIGGTPKVSYGMMLVLMAIPLSGLIGGIFVIALFGRIWRKPWVLAIALFASVIALLYLGVSYEEDRQTHGFDSSQILVFGVPIAIGLCVLCFGIAAELNVLCSTRKQGNGNQR